jgi:hypothetical protein
MRKTQLLLIVLPVLVVLFATLTANAAAFGSIPRSEQDPPLTSVVGAVAEVNKANKIAVVKTDQGATVNVKAKDTTVCLRVPAGVQSLEQATQILFDDITVGDRVLARGSKDESNFNALRIVVLSKADIAKRREHDLEEWRKRGIAGIVKTVNAQTNAVEVEMRGGGPANLITIDGSSSEFRRYTSAAITFEGTKAGTIADLQIGDQLRALGDKNADGKSFKAEAIVSGTFKTIGATITSIDSKTGELKGTTLDKRSPLSIATVKESAIKRIPATMAPAIAQKAAAQNRPAAPAASGQPAPARPPSNPSAEIQQLIDALPNIPLADLKVGDVVSVTGVREKDESSITAIKLVAGVDGVLRVLSTPGRPQVVRLSAGLPNAFDFSVIPTP